MTPPELRGHIRFQSTLPQGERRGRRLSSGGWTRHFNPRSHKGSDRNQSILQPRTGEFQSTLPQGERHDYALMCGVDEQISIHAPTRGATITGIVFRETYEISIHAPTRGATRTPRAYKEITEHISIHAPTRGATFAPSHKMESSILFQSTLPQGERLTGHHGGADEVHISIHAPTRGATDMSVPSIRTRTDFNPRSHKGSDF